MTIDTLHQYTDAQHVHRLERRIAELHSELIFAHAEILRLNATVLDSYGKRAAMCIPPIQPTTTEPYL
jgi:hypothetical protein